MRELSHWQAQFYQQLSQPDQPHRISVYSDSILGAKLASLKITYPAIVRLISEEAFDSIAGSYCHAMAKTPSDIGLLGKDFADYLKSHGVIQYIPYIADLARFEWQWHCAFNAATPHPRPLSRKGRGAQPVNDLSLIADEKTVFIETYDYPVDEIWAACQPEYDSDFEINLEQGEIRMLLYREGRYVKMQRIH